MTSLPVLRQTFGYSTLLLHLDVTSKQSGIFHQLLYTIVRFGVREVGHILIDKSGFWLPSISLSIMLIVIFL